ncbi:LuxR C-terminal-related transcriptional regulator [Nonomuraea sp. JJY05]|uniref:helix-turn-helix transcriptional regulator n=1 Tax=Nonomuraea sp. JJY05 TaxID=3350255 RepID=UPI00373EC1E1
MRHLWPFAGRETQLATIRSAVEAGGAVVAGPAGAGKSRLAAEVLSGTGDVARVLATAAASDLPLGVMAHLLPAQPPHGNVIRWAADALDRERLVLMVDDAHLLDPVSAVLVHHLVTGGRARVLATTRSGERAPDAVTALWKDDLLPRLDLAPLTLREAGLVLAGALGGQVEAPTVRRLWRASDGNALFLRELVLAGESGGALAERRGVWHWSGEIPVTTRLRELIESRIGDVDPGERAALELVAHGEPLPVDALTALAPPETLRRLEDRQLVTISPEPLPARLPEPLAVRPPEPLPVRPLEPLALRPLEPLAVRLAHPLYGEVIRAGCGTLRTREVLRSLADEVGGRTGADPLRVAVWRLDSGTAGDPAALVEACNLARSVRDLRLAARLGRAALAAGGGATAALALASVLFYDDRYDEVEAVLPGLTDAPADDMTRADLVSVHALNLFWGLGREADARAMLTDAHATMTGTEPRQGLLVMRGSIEYTMGMFDQLGRTVAEIRRIAPRTSRFEIGLASLEGGRLLHEGRARQAVARVDEALGSVGDLREGMPSLTATLAVTGVGAAVLAGDLAAARRFADIGYRIGEDYVGWDRALITFGALRGRMARLQGRAAEAVRLCRQAAVRLRGRTLHGGLCLAELAHAYALTGDVAAVRTTTELAGELGLRVGHEVEFAFRLARPWALAAEGDLAGAVEAALETADAAGDLPTYELYALHDVVRLGASGLVADRLARLAGSVEGDLAPLLARHAAADDAPPELDAVSLAFESLGMLLHAAEAAAQSAAAYGRHGLPRRQRAAETRAWRLARRCEGARTPALTGLTVPQLTARQRQIAQLAASGLSNQDIADRLVLSRRTVANTLVQVYERTGLNSRAELADLLFT